jgi:hypothetical protein
MSLAERGRVRATEMSMFTTGEQRLLAETPAAALAALDEDALVALQQRVRRARDKHTGQHRRQAAAAARAAGARGGGADAALRTARKAEIFEDALARVARSLSAAARAQRDELKAERIAAARGEGGSSARKPAGRSARGASGRAQTARRGDHVTERRAASTRATGARNQARRDSR